MEDDSQETKSDTQADGVFPETLWSVVLEWSQRDDTKSQLALQRLCEIYREPVRRWLLTKGTQPEEAEDFTQGFMLYLLRAVTTPTVAADDVLDLPCLVGRFRDGPDPDGVQVGIEEGTSYLFDLLLRRREAWSFLAEESAS